MMKTVLKKTLSVCTRLAGPGLLTGLSGQHLFLPFYHIVSDEDPAHVRHLYPVPTIRRFTSDLAFLQKHFRPVPLAFLSDYAKNKQAPGENSFFLTFDDGLREFYDVVMPILVKEGIPAACFINTAFIDNRDMFFRMKASILIDRITRKALSPGQKQMVVQIFGRHHLSFREASDLLKITDQNKEILDSVASVAGVSFTEYLSTHRPYLTSGQIHELILKGFSIGAHSVSHPSYQALPEEIQVRQTLDCLDFLKDNFNIRVRLFAFPHTDFNIKRSFFEKIREHVDLSFGTAGLKADSIETNLQRTPMEVNGYKSAEDIVKTEYLYFILKRLAGKHKIRRSL